MGGSETLRSRPNAVVGPALLAEKLKLSIGGVILPEPYGIDQGLGTVGRKMWQDGSLETCTRI